MESARDHLLEQDSIHSVVFSDCTMPSPPFDCNAPYRDYFHFFGSTKPWQNKLPGTIDWNLQPEKDSKGYNATSRPVVDRKIWATTLWFTTLARLNAELGMGLGDLRKSGNWKKIVDRIGQPPLGVQATRGDMNRHVTSE